MLNKIQYLPNTYFQSKLNKKYTKIKFNNKEQMLERIKQFVENKTKSTQSINSTDRFLLKDFIGLWLYKKWLNIPRFSTNFSKLYLALAGLVEGIFRHEYLFNKSGKYFLNAVYDLFPLRQIILILG